jgi:hypothetical protein
MWRRSRLLAIKTEVLRRVKYLNLGTVVATSARAITKAYIVPLMPRAARRAV